MSLFTRKTQSNKQASERKQSGFTLIEVLLYVAIVSIIAIFLGGSMVSLLRGKSANDSQANIQDSLRFAEELIVQDIRNATAITTPATAGVTTQTLVLTVAANTVTYTVTTGMLYRQVNANPPQPVTPTTVTVTQADFTRLENTSTPLAKTVVSIQGQLALQATNTSGQSTRTETRKFTAVMP